MPCSSASVYKIKQISDTLVLKYTYFCSLKNIYIRDVPTDVLAQTKALPVSDSC